MGKNDKVDIKLTNPFGDTAVYSGINSVTFSDTNDNEQIFYLEGTDPTMEDGGGVNIPEATEGKSGQLLGINEQNEWAIVDNPLPEIDGSEVPNTVLGIQDGTWKKVELIIPEPESELPEPTSPGAVLTATGTAWELKNPRYLPEVDVNDGGEVLQVGLDGKWELNTPRYLPEVDTNNSGEVLQVGTNGKWETNILDIPDIPKISEEQEGLFLRVKDQQWSIEPSVQGDWSQNNPEAQDYIQNRPFYTRDDLLPLTTLSFEPSNKHYNYYKCQVATDLLYDNAAEGHYYNVKWNTELYPDCLCREVHYTYQGDDNLDDIFCSLVIGNASLWNVEGQYITSDEHGSDLPFVLSLSTNKKSDILDYLDYDCIVTNSNSNENSIQIGYVDPNVKLDVKYLPDEVFTQANWDQTDYLAIDFIKNKPLDRILPIYNNGEENEDKVLIIKNAQPTWNILPLAVPEDISLIFKEVQS